MPWKHWSNPLLQPTNEPGAGGDPTGQLQSQIDGLLLLTQAMWELMQERSGLSEEDLRQRMEEIDLRDGVRDGRMGPAKVSCPSCNRTNNDRRTHCIYCGSALNVEPEAGAV
jgi:hypothetical protein